MMIAEAVIAMIWAAAAMSMFDGQSLQGLIKEGTVSLVVNEVSMTLLGAVGGTIAVLGVVVLPITSGDTAFRAARNIIADYLSINQIKMAKRLMIAIPLFVASYWLTTIDFNILWWLFLVCEPRNGRTCPLDCNDVFTCKRKELLDFSYSSSFYHRYGDDLYIIRQ